MVKISHYAENKESHEQHLRLKCGCFLIIHGMFVSNTATLALKGNVGAIVRCLYDTAGPDRILNI